MQAQVTPRRGGAGFIWKWGAIFGVILGVILVVLSLLHLGGIGILIEVIIWLVGFFLIGMFVSSQTGRVGTGALVGLITGLIGGVIWALYIGIQIAANGPLLTQTINQVTQAMQQQGQNMSSSELHAAAVVGIIIDLVVLIAFQLGLGAGIGALGGLAGRGRARPAVEATPVASGMWAPPPSNPSPYAPPSPYEQPASPPPYGQPPVQPPYPPPPGPGQPQE